MEYIKFLIGEFNIIINQADENMYAIKEQMHVKR
jgi:hypothetical protein